MTVFKLKHKLYGQHVHVNLYAGPDRDHLAHCGKLVMHAYEFESFLDLLLARWTEAGLAPFDVVDVEELEPSAEVRS